MAPRCAAPVVAILAALVAGAPAGAAEAVVDVATETRCDRLLEEAARLTEQAYRHHGASAERAANEARLMLPNAFFFWPAEYFLLYPGTADADFTALRDRMNALAARSEFLGCGIGFHPVPES